jgi:predicted TIM-barrel fold metal-dependent hydrolase
MSKYKVFSSDNHVVEAPNCFSDHVPAKYKDRVPKILRGADGGDGWSWDGVTPPKATFGLNAVAGRSFKDYKVSGLKLEEILPGNYQGSAHLKDMDADGVDGAVIFPCSTIEAYVMKDRELAVVLMSAYNDWLMDEFCSADSTRLVGLAVMPVDDGMDVLLAEFNRVVKKGAKGVMIPYYAKRPYYDTYYDPFWRAAEEASTPVHIHRQMGGEPPAGLIVNALDRAPGLNVSGIVQRFFSAIGPFSDLVFTGLFERFPNLKFIDAEVNGGWLPFWSQMMDQEYERQRHWEKPPLHRLPSEFLGKNLFVSVLDDYVYFDLCKRDAKLARAGLFSTDYPHSTTLYPNTRKYIADLTKGMEPQVAHDLLAGNAVRLYNLEN